MPDQDAPPADYPSAADVALAADRLERALDRIAAHVSLAEATRPSAERGDATAMVAARLDTLIARLRAVLGERGAA